MRAPSSVPELLAYLRRARNFDASEVLAAKAGRIRGWCREHEIDAAVVGVSGGVDSAVVLGLLQTVANETGSPLRRVVAVAAPINAPGATGQDAAAARAGRVARAFGAECWTVDLSAAQDATVAALEAGSGLTFDGWAAGQVVSVQRTPAFYGAVALLRAHGERAVVFGTTNRDEGAYLGFFGKASDGMVDVQPIADLHKSEVTALARELGVPAEVLAAPPSGDVWDGRTDAEMIGTSYDGVELVLRLRELGRDPEVVAASLADGDELLAASRAVDALHAHNAHKYAVGSPAVHLDVMPRAVRGGAPATPFSPRTEQRPDAGILPGEWAPPPITLSAALTLPAVRVSHGAVWSPDVLAVADCEQLTRAFAACTTTEPVGVTGVRDGDGVGSRRATAWSPALAAELWPRVEPLVPSVRSLDRYARTDPAGHRTWRAVGLSPVLRFMRYEAGGRHLVHYDAGYDYADGRRTLMSVVFYLTGGGDGGATRIVCDGQDNVPTNARDHRDWDRDTRPHEVALAITPVAGAALVFDHRTPHDVERWHGPGARVIVRADVVYEAVPDGRAP